MYFLLCLGTYLHQLHIKVTTTPLCYIISISESVLSLQFRKINLFLKVALHHFLHIKVSLLVVGSPQPVKNFSLSCLAKSPGLTLFRLLLGQTADIKFKICGDLPDRVGLPYIFY